MAKVAAFIGFLFPVLVLPSLAMAQNTARTAPPDQRLEQLTRTHDDLIKRSGGLLDAITRRRADELKIMRGRTLDKFDVWEADAEFLDGRGLAGAIAGAEAVAEGYGMDVDRLRDIYLIGKPMVLGLEFAEQCGAGSPRLAELTNVVSEVSGSADGVIEFLGLADAEERRLVCVQDLKVGVYRDMNRDYIRALAGPPGGTGEPTLDEARDALEVSTGALRAYVTLISGLGPEQSGPLAEAAGELIGTLDKIAALFAITPAIGELLDLYKLGTGTSALGPKASDFDRAVAGLTPVTPAILNQALRRYPGLFPAIKSLVKEIAMPAGGFFEPLTGRGGAEMDGLKQWGQVTWAALLEAETSPALAGRLTLATTDVAGESLETIELRLAAIPGWDRPLSEAITASNIYQPHMDVFLGRAQAAGEVIIVRNLDETTPEAVAGGAVAADYAILAVGAPRPPGRLHEDPGELGNYSDSFMETMKALNQGSTAATGAEAGVVKHGPANLSDARPEYSLTAIMPDGGVKIIPEGPASDPDLYLKDFFHWMSRTGLEGHEPHPGWNWGAYDPRAGYGSKARS